MNINKSHFEGLANETIYEIFDYIDVYHVYEGFYDLNERFKNLILNSNLSTQVNISTISKSNFKRYYKTIILPNKHRINSIRLSNPFTIDIVFPLPRRISDFIQLETLVLDNTDIKDVDIILKHSISLPKLHSLILSIANYVQWPTHLFPQIFRLAKLKYCKITYETRNDLESSFIVANEISSIEHLILNTRFRIDSLYNLLYSLPKLRHLSIDYLIGSDHPEMGLSPDGLEHLKHVSLTFDYIHFDRIKKLIKKFFYHIEVLLLTTTDKPFDMYAKEWKQLIPSYMPNLRIFRINYDGIRQVIKGNNNNQLPTNNFINQFNTSFWIENRWYYIHQRYSQDHLDSGIFYSTHSYRGKDYEPHWQLEGLLGSIFQNNNSNSVKYVHIYSEEMTYSGVKYFRNATHLTIKHFKTLDDSISTTLNRIVPLKQLTKLVIESSNFPFEQIVKLLYFTSNLHILKLDILFHHDMNLELIQQSEIFRNVSTTNQIKNLELCDCCSLEQIQLIIHLFPQIEYLKTGMNKNKIGQIIRCLLSKTNDKTCSLFFLCISEIPKTFLRELNMLIKSENLLNDYFIQFAYQDLYLWW